MVCGTAAQQVSDAAEEGGVIGLPLTGDEAVAFLESASVVGEPEYFDAVAITGPARVRLSDGERTVRAVFKDEHTLYPEFRFGDGREVEKLEDSYRHEIAAFELDRLLGVGLVPPCVERKLLGRKGSLCLWIEASRPENERRDEGMVPPDEEAYRNQIREIRLFQQLIADLDFSNIRNIVVDDDFRAYKIDSSLAFDTDTGLIDQLDTGAYSHRLIEALKTLDRAELDAALEPWLTKRERKALWARRDAILDRAGTLIAERGEESVLY
jgi:hypothetical protein